MSRERIVTGIISPLGVAGICELGGSWSITFQMLVWREAGGPIETKPLRIEKPIPGEIFVTLWRWRLRKGQTIRLKVQEMEKPPHITRTVEMLGLQGRPRDAELAKAAHAMLNPADITHPKLGILKASETFHDIYEAEGEWCGIPVKLTLEAGEHSIKEAADHLCNALQRQAEIDALFRQRIVDDYFDIWSEGWSREDESIDRADWIARMNPANVDIDGSGAISIYYDDGELFAGHSLIASMSPDGEIEEAMLVG